MKFGENSSTRLLLVAILLLSLGVKADELEIALSNKSVKGEYFRDTS